MDVKKKILEKAKEEFLNKGIRNMTVQSLVVPLGISTKTFYKYFKNKEELLEEVLIQHYNNQFETIRDYSKEQNPVQLLLFIWMKAFQIENEVNNKFYHDVKYYYAALEKRVEQKLGKYFWIEFERLIQKGMNEGYFDEKIIPELIMESIAILYGSAMRSDQFAKFSVPSDQYFLNTVAILIRGMCTQKGLMMYEEFMTQNLKK